MNISRRDVLLQGSIIGAGIIASNMSGIAALAQVPPPPQRRSLQGLAWNDPIVATYRDAVGIMKHKPAKDKSNWVNLAKIHGLDPNNYHFCPHGNWYFLPWHRAYLVTYERIVRELTKNKDFAMPYWDWTTNPTIPQVFLSPKTPDGKTNWLYVSDPGFKRTWPARKPMPSEVVGSDVLKKILGASNFEEFGTSRPAGQNSLDQSWIVDQDSGIQGVLEGTAHNLVHNNIGGWMPSAISPRDPIFFMHHSNIDRIWAVWNGLGNANSSESLWTDMEFKDNFLNVDGSPYSPKVSELFVPETLGYTYGLSSQAVASAAPATITLGDRLKVLYSAPNISAVSHPNVKTFVAQNTHGAKATIQKYLELPVDVDAGLLSAVARRRPVSAGDELLDFRAAREQAATGTRALAFIRDVATTASRDSMYRVFIDCDYLSSQTPISDPHYVGTFGIFSHGKHGNMHAPPSFAVDLTQAIRGASGAESTSPTRIRLQILPVPNGDQSTQTGAVTVSRVEVAFVSS